MTPDLTNAIVKITSSDPNNPGFGTAFVVYRDQTGDYLLTCKHVVNAVGKATIRVNDAIPADVIAEGDERGLDLALLRVAPGKLTAEPLRLSAAFSPCGVFMTRGFHRADTKIVNTDGTSEKISLTLSEKLSVRLETQAETHIEHAGRRISAVRLKTNDPDYPLLPGYSGAPLIDDTTGAVVGVISIREGDGQRGMAIDAQGIRTLWPDHAAQLFRDIALRDILKEPVMNLERELPEFKRIAAKENQETRLINIHGDGGAGKTHLLDLYRRIANAHHLDCLPFELAETALSFETCLEKIVAHFGAEKFPKFDEFASKGRGKMSEDEWQRNLTRKFFMDSNARNDLPPLLVLFDSHNADKPEKSFKRWLTDCFLPHLRNCRSLLVVVAGQEKVAPVASLERCCQTFELQRLLPKHFHDYAAKWGVQLPPPMIDAIYRKDNGKPKSFVEMIQAFAATPGGAI